MGTMREWEEKFKTDKEARLPKPLEIESHSTEWESMEIYPSTHNSFIVKMPNPYGGGNCECFVDREAAIKTLKYLKETFDFEEE